MRNSNRRAIFLDFVKLCTSLLKSIFRADFPAIHERHRRKLQWKTTVGDRSLLRSQAMNRWPRAILVGSGFRVPGSGPPGRSGYKPCAISYETPAHPPAQIRDTYKTGESLWSNPPARIYAFNWGKNCSRDGCSTTSGVQAPPKNDFLRTRSSSGWGIFVLRSWIGQGGAIEKTAHAGGRSRSIGFYGFLPTACAQLTAHGPQTPRSEYSVTVTTTGSEVDRPLLPTALRTACPRARERERERERGCGLVPITPPLWTGRQKPPPGRVGGIFVLRSSFLDRPGRGH